MLQDDDTLIVWKINRLARSLRDLIAMVEDFNKRGVNFRYLNEEINTTTPAGKLVIQILAAIERVCKDILTINSPHRLGLPGQCRMTRRNRMIIGVTHDQDGRVIQRLSVSTKVSIGLPPNGDRNHPTKLDHFVFLRKKKSATRRFRQPARAG